MRANLRRQSLQGGLLAILACVASAGAFAQAAVPDNDAALATSQAAITRQLGDYQFVDQRGQAFRLSDLGGKPVVLSLVYTSCYHVCSGLTVHVRDVTKVARKALGPDSFTVLTIGFDSTHDTPERMAAFAMPDFALREVTDDPRFGGGQLAANGLPPDAWQDS